jgi:hypothetical protein
MFEERAMAADPDSLVLAESWRKGTLSGGGGCVEAARVLSGPVPADGAPGLEANNYR